MMADFKITAAESYAKRLVRLSINKAGSGRMAAEMSGIHDSDLSRYGNEQVDRHIPLALAIELDRATGWAMLKMMAHDAGFELVTKEERHELALNVNKLVGKLAHASANLTSTAIEATDDGVASHNELKATEACASAVVDTAEKVVNAVAQLRAVS
jgi:hypothetical protein